MINPQSSGNTRHTARHVSQRTAKKNIRDFASRHNDSAAFAWIMAIRQQETDTAKQMDVSDAVVTKD